MKANEEYRLEKNDRLKVEGVIGLLCEMRDRLDSEVEIKECDCCELVVRTPFGQWQAANTIDAVMTKLTKLVKRKDIPKRKQG